MDLRFVRGTIVFLTSAVLVLFISVPLILPYGQVTGLDGTPLIMDYAHIWSEMDAVSALTYGFGDILCHQEFERSVTLNGSQMPVCVRDLFIILGFLIGSVCHLIRRKEIPCRHAVVAVLASVAIMLADHTVQLVFGLNVPSTRAITGFLVGYAVSVAVECWFQHHEWNAHAHLY